MPSRALRFVAPLFAAASVAVLIIGLAAPFYAALFVVAGLSGGAIVVEIGGSIAKLRRSMEASLGIIAIAVFSFAFAWHHWGFHGF